MKILAAAIFLILFSAAAFGGMGMDMGMGIEGPTAGSSTDILLLVNGTDDLLLVNATDKLLIN